MMRSYESKLTFSAILFELHTNYATAFSAYLCIVIRNQTIRYIGYYETKTVILHDDVPPVITLSSGCTMPVPGLGTYSLHVGTNASTPYTLPSSL